MTKNRQTILVILAVIAIVAIYHDPTGSGVAVRDTLGVFAGAIAGIFQFTGAVMR